MLKIATVPFLFLALASMAQANFSGTFSPGDSYTWLILYHLEPGGQTYITDTAIKNGAFSLTLPENSPVGTYRLVYALPQDEFYFDVLYNGKENIQLHFHASDGVRFVDSRENTLFNQYFSEIHGLEAEVVRWFSEGKGEGQALKKAIKALESTQNAYEEASVGLLVQHFIKANAPYIPKNNESVWEYVQQRKAQYFSVLDFRNPTLQASGFLMDKITNYVFTALPPQQMGPLETQKSMQENVVTVNGQMEGTPDDFRLRILYTLWKQAATAEYHSLSDFIHETYLAPLAKSTNHRDIIDEIDTHNRLRPGAMAPEIEWQADNRTQKLSDLAGYGQYLLVFWSSTCGHCLNDLPMLHKKLQDRPDLKVLAIGLEDEATRWEMESGKMENFEHILSLGKWESPYAQLYHIAKTPTYYLLDREKRIIAQFEDTRAMSRYLEAN